MPATLARIRMLTMSSLKIVASVLNLAEKLSGWWHDYNIRKNERIRIEKEINDEIIEDMGLADRVRDELDGSGVRKKYTRKE